MKYRKKPVVIEARQWTAEGHAWDLMHWMEDRWIANSGQPQYDQNLSGASGPQGEDWGCLEIDTLEGTMQVAPFDYIIQGVSGEFYPCKPDIFEQSYEAVGE